MTTTNQSGTRTQQHDTPMAVLCSPSKRVLYVQGDTEVLQIPDYSVCDRSAVPWLLGCCLLKLQLIFCRGAKLAGYWAHGPDCLGPWNWVSCGKYGTYWWFYYSIETTGQPLSGTLSGTWWHRPFHFRNQNLILRRKTSCKLYEFTYCY